MTQVLHKITLVSPTFRHGYGLGLKGIYRNNVLLPERVEEEVLVSIVRNLCELASKQELTEQRLRTDCGIILGWVVASRQ